MFFFPYKRLLGGNLVMVDEWMGLRRAKVEGVERLNVVLPLCFLQQQS